MSKGYSNIPALFQTVLDIPMFEASGARAHDIARPPAVAEEHTMALEGVTIAWAKWPLSNVTPISFNDATPDRLSLSAANSVSMNYMVGAFSGVAWVFLDVIGATARSIFFKGGTGAACGWDFLVTATGQLCFSTVQAGDSQHTYSPAATIVISTWALVGWSRLGAVATVYKNGVNVTSAPAAHINPDTAAALELHVGVTQGHALPFDGYIWHPRIWHRQISLDEHKAIFEMERSLFGV